MELSYSPQAPPPPSLSEDDSCGLLAEAWSLARRHSRDSWGEALGEGGGEAASRAAAGALACAFMDYYEPARACMYVVL